VRILFIDIFKEIVDFLHPGKNQKLRHIIKKKGAEEGNFTLPII